jgi:hypothetical protein
MKCLTQTDIFKVANSETRNDSVRILRKKLDFKLEIADDYKYDILVDVTLDLIQFCLGKGFSLAECVECVELQHQLLEHISYNSENRVCLAEFIDSVSSSEMASRLIEHKLISLIDYMSSTVFTHFHLYKHVLLNERDSNVRSEEREFLGPSKDFYAPSSPPLKEPKPYRLWQYDQQMYEIEMRERNAKDKYAQERRKWSHIEEDLASALSSRIRTNRSENVKLDEEVSLFLLF